MGDRHGEDSLAQGHDLHEREQRTAAHGTLTTSEWPDGDDDTVDEPGDETDEAQALAGEETPGPGPLKKKVLNFNRFIDATLHGLEPMTAVLWFVLFRFERDGITWASQKTIAGRMGVDPKTVMRHLKILKNKQLVRVVKQGTRGGRANTYQLGILPLEKRSKPTRSNLRKPR
jgi:hypothetical protein